MDSSPPIVWKTTDENYLHREVQLKTGTYLCKLLNNKQRTELIGEENTLKDVVENPDYIVTDKDYAYKIHYVGSRYLNSLNSVHCVWLCVDTSLSPADTCSAITSRTIPSWIVGDRILYDRTKRDTP